MNKPMIRIHNTENDEIIDREMNDAEFEQFLKDKKTIEDSMEMQNNKTSFRESAFAKLTALGLTPEEIAAL